MYQFMLPDLGEGIHEGEILKWHVTPGQRVAEDAPLVDVETDKAAVTLPSPRAGVVAETRGNPGETVHVGHVLAVIVEEGEGAAAATAPPREAVGGPHAPGAPPPAATREGPVPAAPATRRLARELGVDLAKVAPTGPGGRVTPEDLRRHAEASAAPPTPAAPRAGAVPPAPAVRPEAPAPERSAGSAIPLFEPEPLPEFERYGAVIREPFRSVRRRTARAMVTSAILVPHVAHMDEADVTELEALRRAERERLGDEPGGRLTLLSFVMKAVVAGLKEHPIFNASLDTDREELVLKQHYHVGFAADTPRGLVVPVVRDADRRTILGLSRETRALAEKAREGLLEVEEMRGGTFTITNVGPFGGTGMVPTIRHPEVAILGMARVQEKPVVRDGQVVIRSMLPLTLAFDHRVADGVQAARFVTDLVRRLSRPATFLVET